MKIPWKRDKSEKDVSEEAESSTDDVMAIADMDATSESESQSSEQELEPSLVLDSEAAIEEEAISDEADVTEIMQNVEDKAAAITAEIMEWAKAESEKIAEESKRSVSELHEYIAQAAKIAKAGIPTIIEASKMPEEQNAPPEQQTEEEE